MPNKTTWNDILRRFVIQPSGCVEWAACRKRGYGIAWWDYRSHQAHRLLWEQWEGPIPVGYELHHRCENRACANLSHLELILKGDHTRINPVTVRRAQATHCPYGHPYEGSNLAIQRKPTTASRKCRECHNARGRNYRKRLKGA